MADFLYPQLSVVATNPSVSGNGALIPLSSTLIGGKSPGGNLLPINVDALGNLTITPAAPPAAIFSGQQNSTGVAIAIAGSQVLTTGVIIQAKSTNTSSIFVGPSGVTLASGFELQPGQATSAAVLNLNSVYIISITSGDGACYIGS